jgi:hypothetical protein
VAALDRLSRRFADRQQQALRALDPVLGAGLEARRGRYIVPWALPRPTAATDWLLWQQLLLWLSLLGATGTTRHLCVCELCSVVFAPRRKNSARTCEMCASGRKRRLNAPALEMPATRLQSSGDRVRIRVPIVEGMAVRGFASSR